MEKAALELQDTLKSSPDSPPESKTKSSPCSLDWSRASFCLPLTLLSLFLLFQIRSLQTQTNSMLKWQETGLGFSTSHDCRHDEVQALNSKLRDSVTFLPLKDMRFANSAMEGHTWFMSSLNDTHEEGQAQYLRFPSKESKGKLLCLKGRNTRDGLWNSYALAWPDSLPHNATLMKGTTFVSYNQYDYDNIWHGLSATMPFVGWHINSNCAVPKRWILYHWGELRTVMAPWVRTQLEATFGEPLYIEKFEGSEFSNGDTPACFEEAVVMRHNEGGMSREKRMEVYDLMRCKSREYCKVRSDSTVNRDSSIGMTMLMRNGARSFKNSSAVISIFENACRKVEGCRLRVAYSHNLTFCEQVKLMSLTDIFVSPHGAQHSNMMLMDRNSSVMEFYPKGWLEVAGVGQYVYHWLADWSGMRHEGAWRDPVGDPCPYPEDKQRCMSMFKERRIGHNETEFGEWAGKVLNGVKLRKAQEQSINGFCGCQS